MKILLAGGGTGGHFYPAVALIEELLQSNHGIELGYVGTKRGIEATILPSYPSVGFFPLNVRGLSRGQPLQNVIAILRLGVAFVQAILVLLRFRPDVVIGMGGYSSFPPVVLASLLRPFLHTRTIIHEQNTVAGLTNRLLAPFVDKVLISYTSSLNYFKGASNVILTGNPVRKEFLLAKRTPALYKRFGLSPNRKTVLAFGGTHGSNTITHAILRAADSLARNEKIQVLLVTGSQNNEDKSPINLRNTGVHNIVVKQYIHRMGEAFALADLVVSRAGATTLAEIMSCGKPSVLIPWQGAAHDHQWENARYLDKRQACAVIDESNMNDQLLVNVIEKILANEEQLVTMASNAWRLGRRQATAAILGEIQTMMRGALT